MGKGAKSKGYIQNLGSKKIQKFIYNPEEYDYGFSTDYAMIKAPGAPHPVYQFVGGNERTITTTILIDGRELGQKRVADWMKFLDAWHPANAGYNNFSPPPMALFAMGSFVKKVLIKDVQYRVILLDSSLKPLRVECDLSMETVM